MSTWKFWPKLGRRLVTLISKEPEWDKQRSKTEKNTKSCLELTSRFTSFAAAHKYMKKYNCDPSFVMAIFELELCSPQVIIFDTVFTER